MPAGQSATCSARTPLAARLPSHQPTVRHDATPDFLLRACTFLGLFQMANSLNGELLVPSGIAKYADVVWAEGAGINGGDKSGISRAASVARASDATVLVLGLEVSRDFASNVEGGEGESNDRLSVAVPAVQLALFEAVAATAKKLVVVVMAGGPVDVSVFKADKRVGALIFLGYPGMQGGTALADVLFGTSVPSGRLPFSIETEATMAAVNVMDMRMVRIHHQHRLFCCLVCVLAPCGWLTVAPCPPAARRGRRVPGPYASLLNRGAGLRIRFRPAELRPWLETPLGARQQR